MCRVAVGAPSLCPFSPAAGTLPLSWGSSRGGEDLGLDQGKIPLAGGKDMNMWPKPHVHGQSHISTVP